MKKSLYLIAALLVGFAFTSCDEDTENVSGDNNRVYNTTTDPVTNMVLDGKADVTSRSITFSMAQPVGYDVEITVGADESYVGSYNKIYSQNAEMLPAENFEIMNPTVTIPLNQVSSNACTVQFKGLNSLDASKMYVLPVKVLSSTVTALASRSVNYYVFRGAALINVVGGLKNTCLTFVNEGQTPELSGLSSFTFECLMYPDALDKQISTLMGIEDNSLLRIGDAGIPSNQLQFAKGSKATDPAWQFETGKWTFLTVTFDGATGAVDVYFNGVKKGSTQYAGRGAINWNVASVDRACYIGYSYETGRDFDGRISEVRIWNKILTFDEINARNHFYRVDNDADGLVGYWKFDEGDGNYVHDYANGYDMKVPVVYPGKTSTPGNLQWYEVQLP